jgi:hypothetical protein
VAKLSRESDSVRGTVGALAALAALHLRRGDDAAAAAALKEKLGLLRRLLVASPARAPLRAAIVASLAALGETYRRRGLAGEHHACCAKRLDESGPGQQKRAKFPTSKAPISAVFHSLRLIFGRAIISRNGLEAWMLFLERARAEHSR